MTASARRKPARATVATLSALGAERLAELLLVASRGDTGLKRVLTLAVASDARDMADEFDRQIQRLRTSKVRLTAPRAVALARELTRLLDGVEESLGPVEPASAGLRLLEVLGLAPEILARRAAPAGAARSSAAYAQARVEVLDALGRKDQAQAARWELFSSRLSADVLRAYLKRLPGFEDVEREEEALQLAERHVDTPAALAFLTSWPDLRRAGVQVRARQARLDGADDDLVRQAEALALRDPLAATLLFRARIASLIASRRPGVYAAAGRHLLDCATLAAGITDWEGRPDHAAYVTSLRHAHPRKAALWRRALG